MDPFSVSFKRWMDSHKLTSAGAAEALHVSAQTIRHWRSQGVPNRKRSQVLQWMETYNPLAKEIEELRQQTLLIRASQEQFTNWNHAALREGKIMEDWARDGLETMADQGRQGLTSLAAEDGGNYMSKMNLDPCQSCM